MNGYAGSILRIDLSNAGIRKEQLSESLAENFLGGRGFVAKMLFDEIPPNIEPYDPENMLIAATGPLTGHFLPASGKTHFGTKSPATGGYADSNMGGHFGPAAAFGEIDKAHVRGGAAQEMEIGRGSGVLGGLVGGGRRHTGATNTSSPSG